MTLQHFEIGTSFGSLADLGSLATPVTNPKSTYSPYTEVVDLADGSSRGVGSPIASWHWDFLPRIMRDQLRLFCPGVPSADVYIRTCIKDNAGAWRYFTCKMKWPVIAEETRTTRAIDFTIQFTQLIDVTPL
jgi:hypothetical protein